MFEVDFEPKHETFQRPYGTGPITVYDVHREGCNIMFLIYLNGKWLYVDSSEFKPHLA